jgi:hypothetical protein
LSGAIYRRMEVTTANFGATRSRRLKLAVGASHEATAAWVRFPELEVQPLSQRYTRIDSDTYRYESATGYSTILRVDEKGLVNLYSGGWELVGSATA